MSFNSIAFAVFFPIVFLVYWRIPKKHQWMVLLVSSYYFYMSWNAGYVVLILFTTGASYLCGRLLVNTSSAKGKRLILSGAAFLCLGVLFLFKYYNFFAGVWCDFMKLFSLQLHPVTLRLLLPVGISFYTFQTLSYVIDVYRGRIQPEKHFGKYAVFVSFFPQLVAGPIGYLWDGSYYYGEIYREPKEPGENRFKDTFERIAGGFGRFEWGEHMDKKSCGYLEALLEYCKGKEIEVIGFVPPYAPSVYDDMVASGKYGYLDEIGTACGILFQKYGYEYFDYTDISVLDMDDSYFVDGFHGSDVAYARMTKDMVSRGEKLKEYVEEEKLDQLLGQRYNNKMFYDFLHKE